MKELTLSTKIYHPNGYVLEELSGILYQPKGSIQIHDVLYKKWFQYDEFKYINCVVRHIYLQKGIYDFQIEKAVNKFSKNGESAKINTNTVLN